MDAFTESVIEQAAVAWLDGSGWRVGNGAQIAPGEPAAERDDYGPVVLAQRLRDAFCKLKRVDAPPAFSAHRSLAGSDSAQAERGA